MIPAEIARAAGVDREVRAYWKIMRQSWEERQEAERAKIEREAPALEAFGFPPEEFVPVEWPGPMAHTFADMVREWEAPIVAHTARKREQLGEAFANLTALMEELDKPAT